MQRLVNFGPALLWIALFLEGPPDVLEEKGHELVGDGSATNPPDLAEDDKGCVVEGTPPHRTASAASSNRGNGAS